MSRDGDQSPGEVADYLAEAIFAIEGVDYNTLTEDELQTLLECHGALNELCHRYRENQRTAVCGRAES